MKIYLVSGEFIDCEGSGLFKLQSCCKFNGRDRMHGRFCFVF